VAISKALQRLEDGDGPDLEPDDFAPSERTETSRPSDWAERITGILGHDGALANLGPHYEERPQQLSMAHAVAEALETGTHAVIEAGTGTGKTLAYLVPALLSGKRVVISTATKALQEQLVEKDLPLLQKLGAKFTYAAMKGRSNYLCKLRMETFDTQPAFVSRDEATQYTRLRTWSRTTDTGDRAELDLPDNYQAWREVSSTTETCIGEKCTKYEECFVVRMRRQAQTADIIVVNHHLFFADLALKQTEAAKSGVEIVPSADAVVFDEAHNMEEVATEFFGSQISNWRFFDLCRDVDRTAKARETWPKERLLQLTSILARGVEHYFRCVVSLAPPEVASRFGGKPPARPVTMPRKTEPEPPAPIPASLSLFEKPKADAPRELAASDSEVLARATIIEIPTIEGETGQERRDARWTLTPGALDVLIPDRDAVLGQLDDLVETLKELTRDSSDPEVEGFKRRSDELRELLTVLSTQQEPDLLYWVEQRGKGIVLRASPIDVAPSLKTSLFERDQPVIMTSATMATGGDTSFFRKRVGLMVDDRDVRPVTELVLPSPFDFETQAALYLPRHLPDPSDEAFFAPATEEIAALIALAKGRTFVLFTSFRAMQEVHKRLGPRIPYQVLVQGQKPKGAILREFRERPSVLFATQSFWEGVDIQGDALSMVIIDKLPFASPGDPLVAARLQAIQDKGGQAFGEYQLPAAAITLKQGFGRLIRSREDTGCVAILDRRLWTKGYGGYFRKSLPPCPTFDRFADVKQWWKETRRHE